VRPLIKPQPLSVTRRTGDVTANPAKRDRTAFFCSRIDAALADGVPPTALPPYRLRARFAPILGKKDSGYNGRPLEAIDIKRRTVFEFVNTPFSCMDEPDLKLVPVSYLYSDGDNSYFLDQENFETLPLPSEVVGNALDLLVEGTLLQAHKYNGNPIALQLPMFVELEVAETELAVRGDTSSGSGTKIATLETGLKIRVPLFIKPGEKVRIVTETREFSGRA